MCILIDRVLKEGIYLGYVNWATVITSLFCHQKTKTTLNGTFKVLLAVFCAATRPASSRLRVY
jgi:hypothetical protein